jgi:hypothetical protein
MISNVPVIYSSNSVLPTWLACARAALEAAERVRLKPECLDSWDRAIRYPEHLQRRIQRATTDPGGLGRQLSLGFRHH